MAKKVLFINLGGIGDEIMFLPAINSFKQEFPDAHITLALEKRSSAIKDLTNLIDDLIFVEKTKQGMLKLFFQMRFNNFDTVISSGSNKLISVLLFLSGIKTRVGYDSGNLSRKLLTNAIPLNKNQYAVKMYHSLVTPFTQKTTELPCFDIEKKSVRPNTILIHPGVSRKSFEQGMIKTIKPAEWAELVKELSTSGKEIILTGGKDDTETINLIKQNLDGCSYIDMTDKTSTLRDLAELISTSERFVCSDSAPLHVAVGMGTRTFVFFGSTDYKKLIPVSENIVPIINDYPCPIRPCLWERRKTTCEDLRCLKYDIKQIAKIILQ